MVLGARSAVFAPLRRPGADRRRRGARVVVQAGLDAPLRRAAGGLPAGRREQARSWSTAAPRRDPSRGTRSAASALPAGRRGRAAARSRSSTCGCRRRARSRGPWPRPSRTPRSGARRPSCCSTAAASPAWRICRACGWIARCPDCDVPLVVHARPEHLVCHHCGHDAPVPTCAPSCRAAEVARQGAGTRGAGGGARRASSPTCRPCAWMPTRSPRRGELEARLGRFARPGAAVLLGTQMVAKGHDLPAITVAGVLDADGALQRRTSGPRSARSRSSSSSPAARGGAASPRTVIVQAWEPAGRAVRLGARARGRGVPGRRAPAPRASTSSRRSATWCGS